MEFKEIVSISGMPGLYRAVNNKSNGLIVTGLEDGKSTFVSARTHGVTPIENIAVYLEGEETTDLHSVLFSMLKLEPTHPIPAPTAEAGDLKKYFALVEPRYDKQKVHVSDMKKMIKWFQLLRKHDLLKEKPEEAKPEETSQGAGE